MTHFLDPPSHDDDELLSAYLDGEATAEETARVDGDPRLQARLRELEAAATLVGSPVERVPPTVRDAAISSALAAADRSSEDDTAAAAPVVHLDSRRRKQWALASVAAVVLLVVIATARMLQPSDNASTTALNQSESKAAPTTLGAPAAAEQATTADRATAASPSYIGAFPSTSALVSGTRSLLEARPAAAPTGAAGAAATASDSSSAFAAAPGCSPDADRGTVVFDGTATLDGQPVLVIVQQDAAGARLLSILDERCDVLTVQAL